MCVSRGSRGRLFILATVSELQIKAGPIPGETSQQELGELEGEWEQRRGEQIPPQKTGAEISHESVGKVRISSGLRVLYAKSSLKPIDLFTSV